MSRRKIQSVILATAAMVAFLISTVQGAEFSLGAQAGYAGGASARVSAKVGDFAQGFPLAVEVALGYISRDPGDPLAARRIFINDNTNGTPESSGWDWNVRLDFMYKVHMLGLQDVSLFAGPRYSLFTGDFVYVGGNEDFEVTTNQWGLGVGAKASFPMSKKVNFTVEAGFDYYFSSTLYGHDTSYSPDGVTVNGNHDYTYQDADTAINQPKFLPSVMLGITVGF
jgi:hypothetical protein